jgi:hypothetical protein
MSDIIVEADTSPDGEEYFMYWLNAEQQKKLINVLMNSKIWLPTDELKKQAAYICLDIGLQLGTLSDDEIIKLEIESR